jgi:hypothetical protein
MFDNDNSAHRGQLIHALSSRGLDAWEFNSGGGIMHVVVSLLDASVIPAIITAKDARLQKVLLEKAESWPSCAQLYIATNSLQSPCEIGLMGNDGVTGDQIGSEQWEMVNTLEEALSIFLRYWEARDRLLETFLSGGPYR